MHISKILSAMGIPMLLLALFSFQRQPAKFTIEGMSEDASYGYTEENPIKVGGGTSAGYHFQYLQHLLGPNGEALDIKRIGSCGAAYSNPDTSLTKFDKGVLTCFSVNCKSFSEPKILYLDKYRYGVLFIPKGFTWKE